MSRAAQAVARAVKTMKVKPRTVGVRRLRMSDDEYGDVRNDVEPVDELEPGTNREPDEAQEHVGQPEGVASMPPKTIKKKAGKKKAANAKATKPSKAAKAPKTPKAPKAAKAPKATAERDVTSGLKKNPKGKKVVLRTAAALSVTRRALLAIVGDLSDAAEKFEAERIVARIDARA